LKFELEKRVLDDEELTPTAREEEVLPKIKIFSFCTKLY